MVLISFTTKTSTDIFAKYSMLPRLHKQHPPLCPNTLGVLYILCTKARARESATQRWTFQTSMPVCVTRTVIHYYSCQRRALKLLRKRKRSTSEPRKSRNVDA